MASPSSGTEVPCSPQSDESPTGDRLSPAGPTELATAEASAGIAVATIAPLAPVERGGWSGVENSRRRSLTTDSDSSAVKHPCRRRSLILRSFWASPSGAGSPELIAAPISKAHLNPLWKFAPFIIHVIIRREIVATARPASFEALEQESAEEEESQGGVEGDASLRAYAVRRVAGMFGPAWVNYHGRG